MKRIIVAHPGQQHSYKTATALFKEDMLFEYITTVYNKEKSLTHFISKYLKGNLRERAINRYCDELPEKKVKQFCELDGLILLLLQRIDKKKVLYDKWSLHITKKFGVKVAKYAIKHKVDAVIVYDTQGAFIGRYFKKKKVNIQLVMDISAANLDYMKNIYTRDMEICPMFKNKMMQERGYLWNDSVMKYHREELQYPDKFLVASQFVETSLRDVGVKQEICICPYGSYFKCTGEAKEYPHDILRLIYVGNTTALKGVYYLFEAMKHFDKEKAVLTVVGNYDDSIFEYLSSDNINFVGSVPHEDVKKYLQEADVFIMPSLGEGMNLSTLEALGMALPCLVSTNSGFGTHIKDGINGKVFPIQDVDAIVNSIQWVMEHKELYNSLSREALKIAGKLSWDNYYSLIQSALKN